MEIVGLYSWDTEDFKQAASLWGKSLPNQVKIAVLGHSNKNIIFKSAITEETWIRRVCDGRDIGC